MFGDILKQSRNLFDVHVIKMVLDKLYSWSEVWLVEFVRNVPTYRSEFPTLLHRRMQKSNDEKKRFPLRHVADVELVLRNEPIGPLQTWFHALRRLGSELNRRLEKIDGKLWMNLGCNPASERIVNCFRCRYCVEQFVHVVETKMAVLEKDPSALCHQLSNESSGMHLLTLAHWNCSTPFSKNMFK